MEPSSDNDLFSHVVFINYLVEHNIIAIIVAASISSKVIKLLESFITDILTPLLPTNYDNLTITLPYINKQLKIGAFITHFITLLIFIIVFYLLWLATASKK